MRGPTLKNATTQQPPISLRAPVKDHVCDVALDVEDVHQTAINLCRQAAACRQQHLEAHKHLQVIQTAGTGSMISTR
jgi:hypothetical protein